MDQKKIAKLSREEKLRLLDLIEEKKRRLRESRAVYTPNEGQRPVHLCKKRVRAVFSGNGCWAAGTMFRMADGSLKRVEDIVVGDQLMGPDSTPRTVLKLYQGQEELFEISPSRSEKYIVNKSHTLSLKSWARNGGQDKEKIYEEVKVEDFINRPEWRQRVSYLWRPDGGVEYPNQSLPIDPYFLEHGLETELAPTPELPQWMWK